MTTYKCKVCSHEFILRVPPVECEVCGGRDFMVLGDATDYRGGSLMAIDKDLFSSSTFSSTIRSYCREIGWNINDINDKRAILRFDMDSGSTQTLFILRYDTTLEFSCPSGVKFNDLDDIPHILSTWLLCANSSYKIGFWCIENISNRKVFSVMHNAEISLIDVTYFAKVVIQLINECEKFEEEVERVLSRGSA